jgi:hypothetical protein
MEWCEKNLKIFRKNPKVSKNRAVDGLWRMSGSVLVVLAQRISGILKKKVLKKFSRKTLLQG